MIPSAAHEATDNANRRNH